MELKLVNHLPILRPEGKLDAQGSLTLQLQLAMALQKAPDLCVIDLANVDAINGTGLQFLATSLKAASEKHCRLVLCNVQPTVQMVLEISRFDSIFEIYESIDALLTHDVLSRSTYRTKHLVAA
jgi:anti-sigma B factor antagonist